MDFGRVDISQLDSINFSLPPDTAGTKLVLKDAKKKKEKPSVYVGCAKWGRPDWVGKIYPKGTKAKDFLSAYAQQFDSLEYNAIFYQLPTHKEVKEYRSRVGENFLFCPKFTNTITHLRRLKNITHELDAFLDVVSSFENNLGPVFLMPHPQMSLKHYDTIQSFMEGLPRGMKFFLELRHPQWFSPEQLGRIYSLCSDLNIGSVITDTAGRRDCVHMHLSTPEVFIRFVGNSLHPTDYTRIDEWVQRIKLWLKSGIRNVYFFMHQHEELYSPELARYLVEQLNTQCGFQLKVPHFVK